MIMWTNGIDRLSLKLNTDRVNLWRGDGEKSTEIIWKLAWNSRWKFTDNRRRLNDNAVRR